MNVSTTNSTDTWLILGASSSLARAFAAEVAQQGCNIILAGRDEEDMEATAADLSIRYNTSAQTANFDAIRMDTHKGFAATIDQMAQGTLNIFLVFAQMPEQDDIDADPALVVPTVTATYSGAVSVLHYLAPLLEQRQAGHVVVVGSVAGDRGRIKNYVYGSAKAGLHAYAQGLRARLFKSGIGVTTVKPGFLDTAMTWDAEGMFLVSSPEAAAADIHKAVTKGKEVIYTPRFWWVIMTIIKHIPEAIMKKLAF